MNKTQLIGNMMKKHITYWSVGLRQDFERVYDEGYQAGRNEPAYKDLKLRESKKK